MKEGTTLEEIRSFFDSAASVPADRVLDWMRSDDLETQAAVVTFLSEQGTRIQPALPGEKVFHFCLDYYKRCLLENPAEGDFLGSRTIEGYTLHNWFKQLWKNYDVNSELIGEMKNMMTDVYKSGDDGVKYAIETAVLEHLFEDPDIAAYFSDWQEEPALKAACERAKEWAEWLERKGESEE